MTFSWKFTWNYCRCENNSLEWFDLQAVFSLWTFWFFFFLKSSDWFAGVQCGSSEEGKQSGRQASYCSDQPLDDWRDCLGSCRWVVWKWVPEFWCLILVFNPVLPDSFFFLHFSRPQKSMTGWSRILKNDNAEKVNFIFQRCLTICSACTLCGVTERSNISWVQVRPL